MELIEKQGFKQTELGWIPEDWIYCSVGEAVENDYIEKPIDGNHGNIHPKKSDFVQNGIPFIMANNVYDNKVHIDNCNYISKNQADSLQKGFSYTGDVLLTHKGTVGNVAIVGELPCDYIMLTPQVTYYRTKEKIINSYLKGYFESTSFQKKLSMLSGGGTRAYIGIVKQRELPLVFPPTLEEQKAIATALSDVDELISNLDKLITKKKAIKQGAMQQLLTPPHKGGKRLKGFTGDWEENRLGEIAEIYQPITISQEKFSKDGYPVYGANGVVGSYIKYNHKLWQTVITCRGSTCGTVNRTVNESWITGNAMVMNVDNQSSLNKEFFYHLLFNCNFISCITGSGQPQIVRQPLFNFIVSYPENLSEQIAIATILSNMDLEIEQLESKKAKYQSVKLGMMQELLTGKTRLV